MKNLLLYLLIFISLNAVAQTSDSSKVKKTKPVNYYSPFHKTNDSATTVSKFGHYISVGTGAVINYRFSGVENPAALFNPFKNHPDAQILLASYSVAYKSHLFSATFGGGSLPSSYDAFNGSQSKYFALLYGQSIRCKHFMASVSAGLALSYLLVINNFQTWPITSDFNYLYWGKISFPVEVKAFYLTRNGVGVGVHLAENIVTTPKYSPFYAGLSVVFGVWNKAKPKHIYCFQPSK